MACQTSSILAAEDCFNHANESWEDSKCKHNASTKLPYKIPKIFKCKTVDQNRGFRKSSTSTYRTFKKGTLRSLDSSRNSGSTLRISERRTRRNFRPRNSRHCLKRSSSKIKPIEKPHSLRGWLRPSPCWREVITVRKSRRQKVSDTFTKMSLFHLVDHQAISWRKLPLWNATNFMRHSTAVLDTCKPQ